MDGSRTYRKEQREAECPLCIKCLPYELKPSGLFENVWKRGFSFYFYQALLHCHGVVLCPVTELMVSIKNVTPVLSQEGVSVKCRWCQFSAKTISFLQKKNYVASGVQTFVNAQVKAPGSTLSPANPTAFLSLGWHSLQRILLLQKHLEYCASMCRQLILIAHTKYIKQVIFYIYNMIFCLIPCFKPWIHSGKL